MEKYGVQKDHPLEKAAREKAEAEAREKAAREKAAREKAEALEKASRRGGPDKKHPSGPVSDR